MRPYELMFIVDADEEETSVDTIIELVTTTVTEADGSIVSTDKWGKRKFAYEINHKTEGHYVVIELLSGGGINATVERQLRLADEVVRHKLLRLPDAEATRRGFFGEVEVEAAAPAAN
jgi:small subunit ribosomal protein S6